MKIIAVLSSAFLLTTLFIAPSFADNVAAADEAIVAETSQSNVLVLPARLTMRDVTLTPALASLHERSGVRIAFSPSLNGDHNASCECEEVAIDAALERMLAGTGLPYFAVGNQVLVEPPPVSTGRANSTTVFAHTGIGPPGVFRNGANAGVRLDEAIQGTIAGSVTHAQTGRPLGGVQVFVEGTNLGALTNPEGQYQIINVPAGDVTVRAQLIGYGRTEQVVRVAAGETITTNFELREAALGLDEVVVTGTAGQARRREVGNAISQIDVAQVAEPVASVDELLTGRAAGVHVTQNSGMAGSGAQIRLRGNVSVAMSNQPLIYVDGVRVRSDGYPKNVPPGQGSRGSNDSASPLNDINPADIQRIEIIKGAAATTLYGTEAAGGVIQIFTVRGVSGQPSWTAQVDQGVNRLQPFGPANEPYMRMDPWLRNAWQQRYSLSVSGGAESVQYFLSGAYHDNEGILPNDAEQRGSVRANLSFTPFEGMEIRSSTSYSNHLFSNTASGNNAHGLTINAMRGDTNYAGDGSPDAVRPLLNQEIETGISRFITGFTLSYAPSEVFRNRITFGFDRADQEARNLRPYGFVLAPEGILSNRHWTGTSTTADYVGSIEYRLNSDIRTTLSFGGQTIMTEERSVDGYAEDFPGPGAPTLSSGARSLSFENRQRVVNAGIFAENLIDFRDRYFLTTGIRLDGNSAFGSNFGLQAYPKVSLSYVISEEPFWRANWGDWKLRAAYGQAGRAPGAFDAVRTWSPGSWLQASSFTPNTVGNPNLGPERTTEFELGLDASLFDGRVMAEFTAYNQRTTDALLPVTQVPSIGFGGSQLENVGILTNRGVELGVDATLYERGGLSWDGGMSVTTNHSEMVDLGDSAPFSLARLGFVFEGHPVPAVVGARVLNADELADPQIETDYVFGPNLPTHIISGRTSFGYRGLTLSARGEYQGGHYMDNRASFNLAARDAHPLCQILQAQPREQMNALQRARCDNPTLWELWIYPADFFRLRDVTLQAPVPFAIPGASSAVVTLSARNAWTWRNSGFWDFDPEMIGNDGMDEPVRNIREHIPSPASFTASVRVVF